MEFSEIERLVRLACEHKLAQLQVNGVVIVTTPYSYTVDNTPDVVVAQQPVRYNNLDAIMNDPDLFPEN